MGISVKNIVRAACVIWGGGPTQRHGTILGNR